MRKDLNYLKHDPKLQEVFISPYLAQFSLWEASYHLESMTTRSAILMKLTSSSQDISGLNILSLLILCGDISSNPGPNWKYPCGVCLKPVKINQKGLLCDSCESWYHARCCSINDDLYNDLANSSCSWICCVCGSPNFSSSLLSNFEISIDNSFSLLSSSSSMESLSPPPPITSSPTIMEKSTTNRSKSQLKAMVINCNGLKGPSRYTEFQALIDHHNPDIILGTESKLPKDIPTYSVFPSNYSIFRKDRDAHGGGVFLALKSDIVCVECPKFDTNCEIIWCSVKFNNYKKLYLASFYRPPSSPPEVLDRLQESINCVFESNQRHPNIVIGGDFNLGDINWNTVNPQLSNHVNMAQHEKLLQTLDDFSLTQHVQVPTRPASNKTLDLILSSYPNNISCVNPVPGISDHLAILFNINIKATRSFKPPHKVYIYKKADFPSFNKYMSKASMDFFESPNLQSNSVTTNWEIFKKTIFNGIAKYIPQRKSTPKFSMRIVFRHFNPFSTNGWTF